MGDIFGKGNEAPPAPDYAGAAIAQGAANIDAARTSGKLMNPEWNTPLGQRRIQYGVEGDPDRTRITDSMTAEGQKLFDLQQGLSTSLGDIAQKGVNRVGTAMGTEFDTAGLSPQMKYSGDPNISRASVEKGLMDRLNPQLQQQRTLTENDLMVQGHNPGGAAWNARQNDMARQENDARLAAIGQAGGEMSRDFGIGQAARGQNIQEQAYLRQLPLTELNALRTGSTPTMPQFQAYQGTPTAPAPIMQGTTLGAQYNLGAAGQQQAGQNAMTSGLFSLGAAALPMFSDARLKTNVERVGTHPLGVGIYEYDIFGHRERGVMAQEVIHVKPSAVHTHPTGYLMVDYGAL